MVSVNKHYDFVITGYISIHVKGRHDRYHVFGRSPDCTHFLFGTLSDYIKISDSNVPLTA